MSAGSRPQRIQGKLDALTKKWWLYLVLLLLFFLPIQAARDFDPRESIDLIGQVLSNPLIYALPILMPVAKAVPVVLIAGLLIFGNRVRRAFNLYVALLFLALAILQTTAVTDKYGLVVITGNLALILVVGLVWAWEVIVERNDFTPRRHRWWKWWVSAGSSGGAAGSRGCAHDVTRFQPGSAAEQRIWPDLLHDDPGRAGGVDAVLPHGQPHSSPCVQLCGDASRRGQYDRLVCGRAVGMVDGRVAPTAALDLDLWFCAGTVGGRGDGKIGYRAVRGLMLPKVQKSSA